LRNKGGIGFPVQRKLTLIAFRFRQVGLLLNIILRSARVQGKRFREASKMIFERVSFELKQF
jgi:hypothetical protein